MLSAAEKTKAAPTPLQALAAHNATVALREAQALAARAAAKSQREPSAEEWAEATLWVEDGSSGQRQGTDSPEQRSSVADEEKKTRRPPKYRGKKYENLPEEREASAPTAEETAWANLPDVAKELGLSVEDHSAYSRLWDDCGETNGYLASEAAVTFLEQSGLPRSELMVIWSLSDESVPKGRCVPTPWPQFRLRTALAPVSLFCDRIV